MKRRILAGTLWFLCGWYVGALAAWVLAVSPILAPILAVSVAALCVGDPRRIIWAPSARMKRAGTAPEPA